MQMCHCVYICIDARASVCHHMYYHVSVWQATCISTGPGINNCICNERYMGDGYNCIGDLLAVSRSAWVCTCVMVLSASQEIGNNPNVSMFYALLQVVQWVNKKLFAILKSYSKVIWMLFCHNLMVTTILRLYPVTWRLPMLQQCNTQPGLKNMPYHYWYSERILHNVWLPNCNF